MVNPKASLAFSKITSLISSWSVDFMISRNFSLSPLFGIKFVRNKLVAIVLPMSELKSEFLTKITDQTVLKSSANCNLKLIQSLTVFVYSF